MVSSDIEKLDVELPCQIAKDAFKMLAPNDLRTYALKQANLVNLGCGVKKQVHHLESQMGSTRPRGKGWAMTALDSC